jgi:hypothetical protein
VSLLLNTQRALGPQDLLRSRVLPVRSEDDFRNGIRELSRNTSTVGGVPFSGGALVFCEPIRVTRPLLISNRCTGITIFADARYPIYPVGIIDTLFDVQAQLVTIRDLFCASRSATDMFTTFVTIGSGGADMCRVLDNYVVADRIYVESASNDPNDCIVRGNTQSHINNTHSAPIVVHGGRARIHGNRIQDGGGDGVTVGAGGDFCSVLGNDLNGSDITTDLSDGFNTLAPNTNVGTVTKPASDTEDGTNT